MKQENLIRLAELKNALMLFSVLFSTFLLVAPCALAGPAPSACSANAESRQLDFWLGVWTVSRADGRVTGTSNVSLSLDKCLVVEKWSGGMGHEGENLLAYSFDDKNWHGMFADNEGRVHMFEGTVTDGRAEFLGPSSSENGEAVLNRLRIVRETPSKVVQTWEKSTDEGKSWTTVFQGDYARRQP